MTKLEFTKPTSDYLSRMGWREDRWVDPEPHLHCLISEGFDPFPAAAEFLGRFGGLDGLMPALCVDGVEQRIHFRPQDAFELIWLEKVNTYEYRVHERLMVVGEAYDDHLTLLLSSQGKLVGAYDNFLCLLGDHVVEGLTTLFERRRAEEIP